MNDTNVSDFLLFAIEKKKEKNNFHKNVRQKRPYVRKKKL